MSFGPTNRDEATAFVIEGLRADFQYMVLKALRDRGMSQAAFARDIGVSPAWVSQMLGDDANLTLETIGRVVAALDIQCSLFAGTPELVTTHQHVAQRSGAKFSQWHEARAQGGAAEGWETRETASFMRITVSQDAARRKPIQRHGNFNGFSVSPRRAAVA